MYLTDTGKLKERFRARYGEDGGAIRLFFAPGTVNLIGDHAGMSGGHVFTCPVDLGVYAAVRARADRIVRISSLCGENDDVVTFSLDEISDEAVNAASEDSGSGPAKTSTADTGADSVSGINWYDGAKGVFRRMAETDAGVPHGFDVLYAGDLPSGEELSFSASIGMLTAFFLREMLEIPDLDMLDLAEMAEQAQDEDTRIRCGIMDPITSANGRKDRGILITAGSHRYEYVPLRLQNAGIVLTWTGKSLVPGRAEYRERAEDCRKALTKLRSIVHISHLCDLSWDRFESCKDVIMNDRYTERARHVVYENTRTIRAVNALRVGNLFRLGEIMNQSYFSTRDNYGIAGPEIECLAETAMDVPGVYGCRLTGEGFGGCLVSVVEMDSYHGFKERVGAALREKFGMEAVFHKASAVDGAHEISG